MTPPTFNPHHSLFLFLILLSFLSSFVFFFFSFFFFFFNLGFTMDGDFGFAIWVWFWVVVLSIFHRYCEWWFWVNFRWISLLLLLLLLPPWHFLLLHFCILGLISYMGLMVLYLFIIIIFLRRGFDEFGI